MDYIKPDVVVDNMIVTGVAKANLSIFQLLLRGFLGSALLGFATTLAYTATIQTNVAIVGALVFPVGFVMIVLLGLELLTGNFALIPVSVMARETSVNKMLYNWLWVFIGHLVGAIVYGAFYAIAATKFGHVSNDAVATMIVKTAEAKTQGYSSIGLAGFITCIVKAILCNWMVCLGAVLAMTSQSTVGKIVAMWLPLLTFFAQGFEHAVVNMFVIPTGMMLGAKVTLSDWWLWNQIPVTIGNLVGGFTFTGLMLYWTKYKTAPSFAKESAMGGELKDA